MKDFLTQHFDKLLLSAIFLILVALAVHGMHRGADMEFINWTQTTGGAVIGALLTLITGAVLKGQDK